MEEERRINWLSLFIKIIIIFIFVLIVVWLISKIIGKEKPTEVFTNNLENMEKIAVDYFKTIDLPLEEGKSEKITLEEMIEKELIISFNGDSENKCNVQESYSEITRKEENYSVETTLSCGDEKGSKTTTFSFDDCKNCQKNEEKEEETENNDDSSSWPTNDSQTSESEKIAYYEFIKETTSYTKWMRGNITGENIENKYEYYPIAYDTYYSITYISEDKLKKDNEYTYVLKLNSVPNSKYYFMTVNESECLSSEEEKYLKDEDISVYKGNQLENFTSKISDYSLKDENITYKLSPYYRKGSFYISVTVKVHNTKNVQTYYDSKLKSNIYLIPLKFNVKFASNQITTEKPSGEYETIPYYRYVTVSRETTWSTHDYLEGYTKTGNIKYE